MCGVCDCADVTALCVWSYAYVRVIRVYVVFTCMCGCACELHPESISWAESWRRSNKEGLDPTGRISNAYPGPAKSQHAHWKSPAPRPDLARFTMNCVPILSQYISDLSFIFGQCGTRPSRLKHGKSSLDTSAPYPFPWFPGKELLIVPISLNSNNCRIQTLTHFLGLSVSSWQKAL
jgi:hypothetical protein